MELDFPRSPCSRSNSPPCCSSSVIWSLNNTSSRYGSTPIYPMESSSPSDTNEIHEQSSSIQDLSGVPLPDSSGEINNRMEPEPADSFELSGEYADNECAIFVSASEYNEKKAQIDQLVQKILTMEQQQRQLEENASDTKELCDLKLRLQKLNARLEALGEFLDTLRVREDQQEIKIEDDSELVDQTEQPKWSNLYSGLNRYRQKANHTAAQFYQHKSNIIDSLKTLYEPIHPRPTIDDLEKQPALLLVRLLKHQQSGLKWMQFRERQKICGGILADDMGLGKTISMIALILASEGTKNRKREEKQQALKLKWTQEYNRIYRKKNRKISMFDDEEESGEEEQYEPPENRTSHAKTKKINPFRILDDDDDDNDDRDKAVVEYEQNDQLSKTPDPEFFSSDEEEEHFTNGRYPSANTLVVCPMSVMCQWAHEVASKVAQNAIRVLTFHGPNRRKIGIEAFRSYDLVITSYNLVVIEFRRYGNASPLFAVHWNRVILDEAHIIRNPKTNCCMSVCQLRARCHWALTGTPVQNRGVDVFALLRFLNVPNFQDLQQWKKNLNESMLGHRRLNLIIKPLMLRRTKQKLQASGDMPALPTLKIELICVQLSKTEMAVYQILSAISKKIFTQFLLQREKGNSDLNYYALERTPQFITEQISDERYNEIYERFLKSLGYNPGEKILGIYILVLLLRLRQFCCHPGLMIGMLRGTLAAEDVQNVKGDASDVEGQLKIDVLSELDKFYESASGDDSCDEEDSTRRHGNFKLEVIKDEIKEDYVPWDSSDDLPSAGSFEDQLDTARALKLLNPQNPIFQFIRPSAKLKLIIDKLEEILTGTNDKIIVTSQWVSYLAIIRKRLQDLSWETLDFNGQLTAKEREIVVRDFNANNDKRVLLLSLTAGGVGLNLNVANHMLIVDLHWNPQLERQAQDRIYRYGQTKPTFIYRYMCQDTVEQRIKSLQDCKLEIAKVVLPEEGEEVSRCVGGGLNLAELKKLLEI
ncbi:transcription termination factor 2 isoform X2 [Drosophila mauritiana]|uniref:Transcription termination factor 2 isoform X2 n=1 Tax=Drosophila mauritiana TaxID=7226 RepID=A0A6P8K2D7_DROMA|nr:transcription termination factor 2 isoform X2 [Drosophila mauritiana]